VDRAVSNDLTAAGSGAAPRGQGASIENTCIVKRTDGVFVDPAAFGPQLQNAVNDVFFNNTFFSGLDYAVFMKVLYDCGPPLAKSKSGEMMIRLADDILEFTPERRALYRAVKINHGVAEYYFEPVYLVDPNDPHSSGRSTQLDFGEFVADMWLKGIRFGIDSAAVRANIHSTKSERVTVARRLEAVPGVDAAIIEVSADLHRSDAPKMKSSGLLDLMAFQNRFPQVKAGERLLKKEPRSAGTLGFELSGASLEPPVPEDIQMGPMAGLGTVIEVNADGEFLVAMQAGFLSVDAKTSQLSVDEKIVSRDGVSSRTTGNLTLEGDYEEFGEVQEKRVIEGESITIHADVFGNVISRGGTITLNQNLVGGTATNAAGDIKIKGIASGATIQTTEGSVYITRAESCTISGTRVTIETAVNCEIIADEITIIHAEGSAVAGRKVIIDSAGPRKQSEMLVYAMVPDSVKIDEVINQMSERIEEFSSTVEKRKLEMETLSSLPDVRKYIMLASKVRKKELVLTADQIPQFQKMALAVGPALKAITKISLDVKAAESEKTAGEELIAQLRQQKSESGGGGLVNIRMVTGDTIVRKMKFNADGQKVYDVQAKDIKAQLRGNTAGCELLFSNNCGSLDWDVDKA
jgi:hypothetical protein